VGRNCKSDVRTEFCERVEWFTHRQIHRHTHKVGMVLCEEWIALGRSGDSGPVRRPLGAE
jgi:hypothetical protein